MFAQYQAFTWEGKGRNLKPVIRIPKHNIDELYGIEKQKN